MIPPDVPAAREALPRLASAVQAVSLAAQGRWKGYAGGEPLPNGEVIQSRSGRYMQSIQQESEGDFAARVFSDAPYADQIEHGAPARDLKRMLGTSLKVRRARDGTRYLIIPFRWGTPGTKTFGSNVMPPEVHQMWTGGGMEASRVTGMGQRASGTGAYDPRTRKPVMVPQRKYAWGDRLQKSQLSEAGVFGRAAKRMAGMVQMRNPHGHGGSLHSQYMTFRVMSEKSQGWLVPATAGKHPAREVAKEFEPKARLAFARAAKADMRAFLPPS